MLKTYLLLKIGNSLDDPKKAQYIIIFVALMSPNVALLWVYRKNMQDLLSLVGFSVFSLQRL